MTVGKFKLSNLPLCGLATGIGSMPFTDPAEALAIIHRYLPAIPHWPQLPRRGLAESFVFQFLQVLVDMEILKVDGDRPYFDTAHPAWPDRLTEFYTTAFAAEDGEPDALRRFACPEYAAPGFYAFLDHLKHTDLSGIRYLKGHLAGPLTAGFQLKDDQGRLAYYQPELRDLIVRTLALHARWQAATLCALGRPAILFVDEPFMNACGSAYQITLTRDMVIEDLAVISGAVHHENAAVGVHSCNAADWSLLFESDLEIIDLDAYRFGSSLLPYAAELEQFLSRGGIMAWGLVPTLELTLEVNAESCLKRLKALWSDLSRCGVDAERLHTQSIITPACGTGLLSPELAERVYQLTSEVSAGVRGMIQDSGFDLLQCSLDNSAHPSA
jgi:hypothetical protein